jgi:hypothetical protein
MSFALCVIVAICADGFYTSLSRKKVIRGIFLMIEFDGAKDESDERQFAG